MPGSPAYTALRAWAQTEFDRRHPAGRPRILLGLGTCGLAAGGREVLSAVWEKLAGEGIEAEVWPVGCIGACFAEPLMDLVLPEVGRISYRDVTPERAVRLIDETLPLAKGEPEGRCGHLHPEWALAVIGDEPVDGIPTWKELPFFQYQERRVLRNCGFIDPSAIEQYILRDGYQALAKALTEMSPEAVIEEVQRAGLRGRGGTGFPTGRKWQLCRQAEGEPKYLVCNFDEGEPGAFMNRSLVEGDPHCLLEGLILGAYAIGASHGYIYVRAEYPLAIVRLRKAIQQAEELGLLGNHILGSDFSFDVTIKEGAGAFVCGEETALLASIEGRRGMPRPRPPFPAQKGLWGQPTVINNVDTLANIAHIIRQGAEWFAEVGSETSKGTKTFCLTGKIPHTGLIEVPMGTPLGLVIEEIGGGILKGRAFKAAQTGGPSGGCLATQHLNLPLDYESLTGAGSIMGSGGLVVMDEDNCMVDIARFFLSFTQQESCGKCTPCRLGTKRMLEILERIVAGEGSLEDLDRLAELGETVQLSSLCGLGQAAPNPVLSTLRYFREEYEAHIVDKKCPAGVCQELMLAPCHNRCPAGQNVPLYVWLIGEGRFEEALEVIRDTNPFPSVCGRVCDHNCEYKCRRGAVDEPIAIRSLKRFAADYERLSGKKWQPRRIEEEKDQKVAIVGGGPAGLTAAYYLGRRGYRVTVFEALPMLGGMLAVGIPEYRLPKAILQAEIDGILSLGIEVKLETAVGRDVMLEELREGYDAVYLATGAHLSRPLGVPGEELEGVIAGATFLRELNLGRPPDVNGKKVVVIGAGNVAMDAARSALRLGAAEVQVLYRRTREEAPALGEELEGAEEEGVHFQWLTVPVRCLGNGRVTGVECRRAELGSFDASGRRRPVEIPGSEFVVPADVVIPAVTQACDLSYVPEGFALALGDGGRTVAVDPRTGATNIPGLFAGGDVTAGPATVIEAIAAGKTAATSIDRYLKGLGVEPLSAELPRRPEGQPPEMEEGEQPRQPEPALPVAERRSNFREVELGYTVEQAVAEARRCLRCDLEERE